MSENANPTRALNSQEIIDLCEQYIKLYYRNAAAFNDVMREEIDLRAKLPSYDGSLRFIQTDKNRTPYRIVYKTAGHFNRKELSILNNYKTLVIDSSIVAVITFLTNLALMNLGIVANNWFALTTALLAGIGYALLMPATKPYRYKTIPIITELMNMPFDANWLLIHDYIIEEPGLNRELRMFCANYGIGLCSVNHDGIVKVPIAPLNDYQKNQKVQAELTTKPLVPTPKIGYTQALVAVAAVLLLVTFSTSMFKLFAPDFSDYTNTDTRPDIELTFPKLQKVILMSNTTLDEESDNQPEEQLDDPRIFGAPTGTWAVQVSDGQSVNIYRPISESPCYIEYFFVTTDPTKALDTALHFSYQFPVIVILGPKINPESNKYMVAYGKTMEAGEEISHINKKLIPPTKRILLDHNW
jgi:hypothetical protein